MIIILGGGCAPAKDTLGEAMPIQLPHLFGNWEKITDASCSDLYPDTLQFQEGGLYVGQNQLPGSFTLWDVGTFEVVSPGQMKLSTANDAIMTYEFSLEDNLLKFVDSEGCEYSYRRGGGDDNAEPE